MKILAIIGAVVALTGFIMVNVSDNPPFSNISIVVFLFGISMLAGAGAWWVFA